MDSRYRFLTLGIPWTQSMPSRDVNAATRLAEASWRRDNIHRQDTKSRQCTGWRGWDGKLRGSTTFSHPLSLPFLEAVYCFIYGRRRVAVAQYRMICLVPAFTYMYKKKTNHPIIRTELLRF